MMFFSINMCVMFDYVLQETLVSIELPSKRLTSLLMSDKQSLFPSFFSLVIAENIIYNSFCSFFLNSNTTSFPTCK